MNNESNNNSDKIVVLDFGAQYGHLIARRIRELNVYSEIMEPTVDVSGLKNCKGIILSGGPSSVNDEDAPEYNPEIFKLDIPILGICYGHQVMSKEMKGSIKPGKSNEYGIAKLDITDNNSLFKDMDSSQEIVWMSHGDSVDELPNGFKTIASTADCAVAAIANESKKYYGLQFHPEVTHTKNGQKIFDNFINICSCKREWTMKNYVKDQIDEIKNRVGDSKKVFLLVSGGVDSTVAFSLLNKALGNDRVYGLHIDNGLMRKNESEFVDKVLRKHGFDNFHVVDAGKQFIDNLKGVTEPEAKRKIIGDTFIDVQKSELARLDLDEDLWLLGQGTIYPDTIESSGTKNSALIKTHHNRVEIIQKLIEQGKVIEPLAQLYKDEVRAVGKELELPYELVWRHPFPGPGLGVRVLCNNTENDHTADEITEINGRIFSVINNEDKYLGKILPIKSVGVQGDFRTYRNPCVIYSKDLNKENSILDYDELEKISTDLTNKVPEINRVVLCLTNSSETLEKRPSLLLDKTMTVDRIDLLKEADNIAMNALIENKLMDEIWQMPTVLIPISFGNGESIVLRPVLSKEAMTASFARIEKDILLKMATDIKNIPGIDEVFFDLTHKPPGTIEWE